MVKCVCVDGGKVKGDTKFQDFLLNSFIDISHDKDCTGHTLGDWRTKLMLHDITCILAMRQTCYASTLSIEHNVHCSLIPTIQVSVHVQLMIQ